MQPVTFVPTGLAAPPDSHFAAMTSLNLAQILSTSSAARKRMNRGKLELRI
jgi:hypothetical protein